MSAKEDADGVDEWPVVDADGSALHGTGAAIVSTEDHIDVGAIDDLCGLQDGTSVCDLVRTIFRIALMVCSQDAKL